MQSQASSKPTRAALRRVVCHAGTEKRSGSGGGLKILELGIPFGSLVKAARFGWSTAWLVMMNELAPSGPDGDYKRPAASRVHPGPSEQWPAQIGKYTVYAGVACPW